MVNNLAGGLEDLSRWSARMSRAVTGGISEHDGEIVWHAIDEDGGSGHCELVIFLAGCCTL